jgi:hypothetical protein
MALQLGLLDRSRKTISKEGYVEVPVTGPLPGREARLQEAPDFYDKNPELADLLADSIPGWRGAPKKAGRSW